MSKKFIIAWIVLSSRVLGDFVVHAVLLHSDYMQLTNLYRTEGDQQKYFPPDDTGACDPVRRFRLDLRARRRSEAVDGAGRTLWSRRRTAYGRADLPDLLRGAANAWGCGC